jgi:hypothetical protein
MLDYIRNPFAEERVSAVVGKIKISNKKIMNISSTLRLDKLFKLTTMVEEC